MNYINIATRVISEEAMALGILAQQFPEDFEKIIKHIINSKSRIILTGIGKSGYIARKIAASFSSTGTTAFYIHPAEASHGDLGMITQDDLVIILSKSGETKELYDIINYCKRLTIKMVGMTANKSSTLAQNSDYLLLLPNLPEASSLSAPTTSSLVMLAIGDALTITVQEAKGFNKEDFSIFHPGGKIGANLLQVQDIMRIDGDIPLVYEDTSFTETILTITKQNSGCAIVVDKYQNLKGMINDGDLRKHIHGDINLKYACDTMTPQPLSIHPKKLASEALCIMNQKSITALPVAEDSVVVGIIHIHDILKAGIG